jgi:hypothetical protein
MPSNYDRFREATLLDDVAGFIGRYVALSTEARDAIALWVAHTHCLDAFESTPRLALISPVKQSGKTRTLEVVELLVPNPMNVVNTTSAALFRQVAAERPTLLMDEADTYLSPEAAKQHEELRAFVNAGHRRAAKAWRCVGEPARMRVEAFPAYCALAIAGIGDLPETVIDRAVVVKMKRRARHEHIEPFRARQVEPEGAKLRARLVAWAKRNSKRLGEPEMPDGIVDRAADVWEALLSIADLVGGDWPERARTACVKLNADRATSDIDPGIRLLGDIRSVFPDKRLRPEESPRLRSEALVERLVAIEESPWAHLRRGPLSASGLARRLRPFDIRPDSVRFGDVTFKGYLRASFEDAWDRYLPASMQAEHPEHVAQDGSGVPDVPASMGEAAEDAATFDAMWADGTDEPPEPAP